ncbi:MAG: class I SAM-dependent methyltransferase, partial [bacterium]
MASAETFYDQLAADYDGLTHTSKRNAVARGFVSELHRRAPFSSALDAACGTGVFTRALAEFASRACGADISSEMLHRAKQESRHTADTIQWLEAPMQNLPEILDTPFECILCMGNSLPHLITRAE